MKGVVNQIISKENVTEEQVLRSVREIAQHFQKRSLIFGEYLLCDTSKVSHIKKPCCFGRYAGNISSCIFLLEGEGKEDEEEVEVFVDPLEKTSVKLPQQCILPLTALAIESRCSSKTFLERLVWDPSQDFFAATKDLTVSRTRDYLQEKVG